MHFKLIILTYYLNLLFGDWGLGIGDWDWGPIPNPQSPIPNNIINNILLYNKEKQK